VLLQTPNSILHGETSQRSGPTPISPQMVPHQFPVRPTAPPQVWEFPVGQEVEVYLRTNVWVVGIVIGTLKFFNKFAGWGYEISYRSASQQVRDEFPKESVRPRRNPTA